MFVSLFQRVSSVIHPDHLLLDSVPNIGPLISCWELEKFKNCWNKISIRTSKSLTLLYQQFSNLLISQRDISGPRLGALSNNRWSGGNPEDKGIAGRNGILPRLLLLRCPDFFFLRTCLFSQRRTSKTIFARVCYDSNLHQNLIHTVILFLFSLSAYSLYIIHLYTPLSWESLCNIVSVWYLIIFGTPCESKQSQEEEVTNLRTLVRKER